MRKRAGKHDLVVFPVLIQVVVFAALISGLAAAEVNDNLKGVPPSPASEWRYYGFDAGESKKWIKSGIIFAAWATQWRDEGFGPEAADKWKNVANVYTAGKFLRNGFGPQEAEEWISHGIRSGLRAREYAEAGLTAKEAATFWKNSLYPDDVKEWHDAGFEASSMLEWRYGSRESRFFFTKGSIYGRSVYKLEAAVRWRDAGFTAREAHLSGTYGLDLDEAIKWGQAGFSFDEAVRWRDSGFTLSEAFLKKNAGLTAAAADLQQYDQSNDKADEIMEYHTDLTVNPDGTIDVVETIALIDRPGGAYEKGFEKKLPDSVNLRSLRFHGFATNTPVSPSYHVRSVEVDGKAESFEIIEDRLHVGGSGAADGKKARLLRLSWQTDSRILHQPHHDEFCFPVVESNPRRRYIRTATAMVRLPAGAEVIFADGLAGLNQRRDFSRRVEETATGDVVYFAVTRPLREKMGFAVTVGFINGVVRESLWRKLVQLDYRLGQFLSSLAVFLMGFLLVFSYYFIAWYYVGRDPKGFDSTATAFSAPGGMDPGSLRALEKNGKTDHVSVAAELLFLAEKRMIRITESEGVYKIEKTATDPAGLPATAKAFVEALFVDDGPAWLTHGRETVAVAGAARKLKTLIKKRHAANTAANRAYLWPGLMASLVSIAASLAILDYSFLGRQDALIAVPLYAVFVVAAFGLLSLIFMRLLRLPTEAFVSLCQRTASYVRFLRRDFAGRNKPGFIPPNLRVHLAYAMAAGIAVDHLMIRNNDIKWYYGTSGGFDCGHFIKMVKQSM